LASLAGELIQSIAISVAAFAELAWSTQDDPELLQPVLVIPWVMLPLPVGQYGLHVSSAYSSVISVVYLFYLYGVID
jgi:hypothetical protein